MVVIKHRFVRKAEVLSEEGDKILARSPILIMAKTGASGTLVNVKTAAFHGQIIRDSEGNVDLISEMRKHPDALWIRVKAIEADVPNDNGDYFSWDEIIKSYKTFEGAPVFTNHENNKVEAAKGKVVKAELDEQERAVYCTMFIDRQAHASLCRAIEEGYVTDVSMGTQVDYSTCSVCNNKAYTAENYCFVPGTPILMSDLSVKNIENISIGDEVIDAFGSITKVVHTFKRQVKEITRRFTSRSIADVLGCTANHQVLTLQDNKPALAHAGCLDDNSVFLCPIAKVPSSDRIFSPKYSEEQRISLCRLLGYYTSEGSRIYDKNGVLHGISFTLGFDPTDVSVAAEISSSCESLLGIKPEVIDRRKWGKNTCEIRLYDRAFAPFVVKHISGGAKDKSLSQDIVGIDGRYLKHFLAAYIDGDGHADKHGHIVLSCASQSLASQIYHLLLRIGCSPNIGEYENSGGPTNRSKKCTIYKTELSNCHVRMLKLASTKCQHASETIKAIGRLKNVFTEDGAYSKHRAYEAEDVEYDGPVYNIETETGTYVAANTGTKNCDHVKTMKGRAVNGTKVFERNYGLKFIEISVVTDGACKDCTIREVLDPEEYVQRVASAVDCLRSYRTAASIKHGGPQEIQKMNQAMDLLEDVARAMLDQRQYIDMEFLEKLSGVLSELQHVNDELVDQGYGRMPSGPAGGAGGAEGAVPQMGISPLPEPGAAQGKPAEAPKPFVAGPAGPGVGTVTEPATAASDAHKILSARIEEVKQKVANIYQEKLSMGAAMDQNKANQTISKLAKIWENPSVRNFRTEISDGEFTVVVGDPDIFGLKGGKKIASLKIANLDEDVRQKLKAEPQDCAEHLLNALQDKYAKAAKEPGVTMQKEAAYTPSDTKEQQEQTMEAQLRTQKLPIHPRTDEIRESITEDQLKKNREGYGEHARQDKPRDSITEAQLGKGEYKGYEYHKRQDKPREEVMEGQLRDEGIKGNVTPADKDGYAAGVTDQKQQITEGQLEDWKKADKGFSPTDRITEKQLVDDAENWGRRIASREDAVKAKTAVLKAAASTSVATGATPDEILSVINDFTGSAKNHMAAEAAVTSLAGMKDHRQAILARAKFHGAKVASTSEVADYLLGAAADQGMSGEVALATLAALADQKTASGQISEAITAAKAEEKAPKTASSRDFLKEAFAEGVEDMSVLLDKSAIKADEKDAEKFAAAAFELAVKTAEKSGYEVKDRVHVTTQPDGKIEVAMTVTAAKAKKEKKEDKEEKEEKKEDPKIDLAARKDARKVVAQMGGAMPDAGGGGGAGAPGAMPGPGGGTTMPPPPPGAGAGPEAPPVAALGAPPGGEGEEADEAKEALPPGSICPVCGSENVDIKHGDFTCNDCGGAGEIQVSINIKEWPGVIEDTEPKGKDEGEMEGGIGDMGGGPGMEMPPVGLAAAFKVTPEMVKIAGGKPIGTFCPHCGSSNTKLAMKQGSGTGRCQLCKGAYRIDTLVDVEAGGLLAKIAWYDLRAKKYAAEYMKTVKQAASVKVERKAQKVALMRALRDSGQSAKFANADLKGKAQIIAGLADKGLIKKA